MPNLCLRQNSDVLTYKAKNHEIMSTACGNFYHWTHHKINTYEMLKIMHLNSKVLIEMGLCFEVRFLSLFHDVIASMTLLMDQPKNKTKKYQINNFLIAIKISL